MIRQYSSVLIRPGDDTSPSAVINSVAFLAMVKQYVNNGVDSPA